MHFVGMSAVTLSNADGQDLPIKFRVDLTITSLIAVLVFTALGLWIGGRDKAFIQDHQDIVDSFVESLRRKSITEIRNMKHKNVLLREALFRNMLPLLIGGFFIGSGVCIMHYIGMLAMVFDGYMEWNAGIVAASCLIALVAATAALWIMFRLLAMFPNWELLRFICAVVMAIAVNGMHYTGMAAATFKYEAGKAEDSQHFLVSVQLAVMVALIASVLFISFVFVIAVSDLRIWYHNASRILFELDNVLEPALREESKEKRLEFLEAYAKFRGVDGERYAQEFRNSGRKMSRSNSKSIFVGTRHSVVNNIGSNSMVLKDRRSEEFPSPILAVDTLV